MKNIIRDIIYKYANIAIAVYYASAAVAAVQTEAVASGTIHPINERSVYNCFGAWPVYFSVLAIACGVPWRNRRMKITDCHGLSGPV